MKRTEDIEKIKNVVLYILHTSNGISKDKLYAVMYLSQKDYLTANTISLCPDTFKAYGCGPVPIYTNAVIDSVINDNGVDLMNLSLEQFRSSIHTEKTYMTDTMLYSSVQPDLDYIAVMQKKCLDKWISICRDMDKPEMLASIMDEAWSNAWKLRLDDPEQGIITNIAMARAGGASDELVSRIRERLIIDYALGNMDSIQ